MTREHAIAALGIDGPAGDSWGVVTCIKEDSDLPAPEPGLSRPGCAIRRQGSNLSSSGNIWSSTPR